MTELFGTTAIPTATPASAPVAPKKHGWLPLLTILFLISYGLMTMLIVEQGSTIESQKALIRELFRDSSELTAAKMKAQRDSTQASRQSMPSPRTPAQSPSTQVPMAGIPMTQAPASPSPSSQAATQSGSKKSAQKPQFRMPSKPASDLVDDRRALIAI